jgi:hypothetical protein
MAIKVKNARKIVAPGTRYANDVRMAIEMEQGNPLTAGQDILLEQLAAEGKTTAQQAVEKLLALRPKTWS